MLTKCFTIHFYLATKCRRPYIFQTLNSVGLKLSNIKDFHQQHGYWDIGV